MPLLNNHPPPTPLAIFSFFYPLPVKLKWNLAAKLISDNSSSEN